MALERERKYLLKYLPVGIQKKNVEQGYLMLEGKDQLRVRIIDDSIAHICYKSCVSSTDRNEYEYEIPLKDGRELFSNAKYKLTKERYDIKYYVKGLENDLLISIDMYPNGLKVVEVEYENESDIATLPDFFGEEVTEDKRYSNVRIATHGYPI